MAKLWWQSPDGRTHGLDLTEYADLSVLNEGNAEIAAVSTSWAGRAATLLHHRLPTIAVEVNDVSKANAAAVIALLRNFAEHYRGGGLFGFAVDEATAWFSYLALPCSAAGTRFTTAGNVGWTAGAGSLPIGAEIVVEQGYTLDQVHGVTSAPTGTSGGVVDVSAPGAVLSRDAGAVLRTRDYYPALIRDDGEGFTESNDRGMFYSFRFTAQVYLPAILEGEGLWDVAYLVEDTAAPSGRRITDLFFPPGGPSPFSPSPRRR
jgi:hypothetical protein